MEFENLSKSEGTDFSQIDLRELRRSKGLNQTDFWKGVGVTQSGGSRYEDDRRVPKPVQELVRLKYIEGVDLDKVNRLDLEIAALLKKENQDLYKALKREVKKN